MAGNKIFYVTRTEDESTQTAGAATKTRADKPQLLKIVGVDHAGNPDPATPEDNQIYATEEENQEILLTSDTVQEGDYNPVTSDAVFHYAKPPHPDWANAIPITPAQLNAGYAAPSDGMFVGAAYNPMADDNYSLTLNGTDIMPFFSMISGSNGLHIRPAPLSLIVNQGDILGCTAPTSSIVIDPSLSFVPWK